MQITKTANVVLAEASEFEQLRDRELYRRLNWIGGKVVLDDRCIMFEANRLNRILNKARGVHELHMEFGFSADAIADVTIRSWMGFGAIILSMRRSSLAMAIRCRQPEEFAQEIERWRNGG